MHFLSFTQIRDDNEYLTQMVQLYNDDDDRFFALAFKSHSDDKCYYVKSQGVGQPLVIDSTIAPPYIFCKNLSTDKEVTPNS